MSADSEALACQPIATAPRGGTAVRLVLRANGTTWRTPTLFAWQHGKWRAVASGIPVGSSVDVVGWDRVEGEP